jgi:hypothetical protein
VRRDDHRRAVGALRHPRPQHVARLVAAHVAQPQLAEAPLHVLAPRFFGKGGRGDADELQLLGQRLLVALVHLPPQGLQGGVPGQVAQGVRICSGGWIS